jgi:hypothetical protein
MLMRFLSCRRNAKDGRKGCGTPNRPFRPRLESLEGRATPATFLVTTTHDDITPGNGQLTLREAISKANANPDADTIVVPAGIYRISLTPTGDDFNLDGDFDIRNPLTILGAGAGRTILDGQHVGRVIDLHGTTPGSIGVVLQGLTIRNGNAAGPGGGIRLANAGLVVRDSAVIGNRADGAGGGISNADAPGSGNVKLIGTRVARNVAANGGGVAVLGSSHLRLENSTVQRNLADTGGGILTITATLANCTVSGNSASLSLGGGILAATVTLSGCRVNGNSAADGMGGGGIWADTATLTGCTVNGNYSGTSAGGIWADTAATLVNCTVSGNTADSGAGGGVMAETGTFRGSTFRGNSASDDGGGIWTFYSADITRCTIENNRAADQGGGLWAFVTANVTNSALRGNVAAQGGGLFADKTVFLTNSSISGNAASGAIGGGGLWADAATLTGCTVSGNATVAGGGGGISSGTTTLLNCTIVDNVALALGGGVHALGGPFNVKNTLIALNLVGLNGTGPDTAGTFTSQGNNLIGAGGTGFADGINGDIVGTSANPIDPKVGPLANNGGKTKTHALLAGSKAIDAGNNVNAPPTDQRGQPRRKDGNGDGIARVDIGAVER